MKPSSRFSLAILLATILAVCLTCSWSLRTVNATSSSIRRYSSEFRELFEPTSDAWANEEFLIEMADHPAFDEHLESVLADLQGYEFDIEADDALLQYMSTLSDSEARAEWRRFRRAFRRVGRVFRKVVKVVKKALPIVAPIALTMLTGGLGAPSLAGSLGSTFAKGAAMVAKVSSIASKAQAVVGGLNAVTGGKSKFLNKVAKFTNKVTNVLGKGSMILNAGGSLANGLSNFSAKGLVSQLKPANLFKGATLIEKGSNFLKTASGLIKKGQDVASSLNNLTGGKIKALNKISKGLDKAQQIAGVGTSALNGIGKGFDSLKNLKNIKSVDMGKLFTAENIKKGLGKLDNTIGKTKDILSNVNEITGGKSKKLNKIIGALDKTSSIVNVGSTAVDRIGGIKKSISDLKNLNGEKIKELFTNAGIQKALGKLDNTLGKGKDFLQQVNQVNGGKSKTLNNLIQKLEKGQQAVGIGSTVAQRYEGIKNSIDKLSNMKSSELKNLLNFDNLKTGLGKASNAMSKAEDLVSQLNTFTNGRSKTLVGLVEKLKKGQKVTSVTSNILDGAKGIKGSLEQLKNLKKADLEKVLEAEHLQGVLNRVAKAFSKGENIVSEMNEINGGKSKGLANLLQSLRRGQMIANTASSGVGTIASAKNSFQELNKLKGKNLGEILKSDELNEVIESWKGTFEQGKEFTSQYKELRNEFKKQPEIDQEPAGPVDGPQEEPPINEPIDGAQGEPDQSFATEEPVNSEEPADFDPSTAMG